MKNEMNGTCGWHIDSNGAVKTKGQEEFTNWLKTTQEQMLEAGDEHVEFDKSLQEDECLTLPGELYEFTQVLLKAANKGLHPKNNWLKPDGRKCSHKDMHASIFRHVAESSAGNRLDKDTGLDHLLHAACRCMMYYVRLKNNLIHPDDKDK